MDKKNLIIIGLIVLLIGTFAWIGAIKYNEAKTQEQLLVFQQGADYGYKQAVYSLLQQATTCEPVSVMAENQTVNMIALECLQQS